MSCWSCASENQTEFPSEIDVHQPGLKNVHTPPTIVFPKLLTCMKCGFTEFKMPEDALRLLGKSSAEEGAA
jgi:hypothetical protein